MEGVPVGYGICFFDPFAEDPDETWRFTIRLGHSREYMDEDQKERLEAAIRYLMLGVQKIFNVDKDKLKEWLEEDKDDIRNFMAEGKFH
jgi:hypothetical protein